MERRCCGVAFEEAAPVREFPSYRWQRNSPGLYWADTMLRHAGALESRTPIRAPANCAVSKQKLSSFRL